MPSSVVHSILESCREPGCPICRLEQRSVERYLDNHFYENVNSPKWRDALRATLGFCYEHAWLGVDQRLGDALGYSIIYHDIVNSIVTQLEEGKPAAIGSHRRSSLLRQLSESARDKVERMLDALTPRKRCPVCEHRDQITRTLLSTLIDKLGTPEMLQALQVSDGLCLAHLRLALEHVRDQSACDQLLSIHLEKLENLKTELSEFIRKNDYQAMKEGFGREGDAWLRAVGMIVGKRRAR